MKDRKIYHLSLAIWRGSTGGADQIWFTKRSSPKDPGILPGAPRVGILARARKTGALWWRGGAVGFLHGERRPSTRSNCITAPVSTTLQNVLETPVRPNLPNFASSPSIALCPACCCLLVCWSPGLLADVRARWRRIGSRWSRVKLLSASTQHRTPLHSTLV